MMEPLAAWLSIKDRMRDRMTPEDYSLCLLPAEMLRAMAGPHEMFRDVPKLFQQRRGGSVLVSPVDYAWLELWAQAGIPSVAVLRAIDALFARRRSINSIAYCRQQVYRESELMQEAAVGFYSQPGATAIPSFTLLIALPRNGRAIYKALGHVVRLQDCATRLGEHFQVALTVQPDDWQSQQIEELLQTEATA